MERMEKRTDFYDFIDKMQRQDRYIEYIEEENKNLKEEIENHKQNIMQDELEIIPKLEEENKKLKEECEENDYLVEDNARWMKECEKKTMEIKKLKSDLAYERTMLDNVRAEYESLQNVIKKLIEERDYWEGRYRELDKLVMQRFGVKLD